MVPEEQLGRDLYFPVPPRLDVAAWNPEAYPEAGLVEFEKARYVFLRLDPVTRLHIYVFEADKTDRPAPGAGRYRHCRDCDVKWWGDETCWYCEGRVMGGAPYPPPPRY